MELREVYLETTVTHFNFDSVLTHPDRLLEDAARTIAEYIPSLLSMKFGVLGTHFRTVNIKRRLLLDGGGIEVAMLPWHNHREDYRM
jgi:hypothetical protein